MTNWKECKLGDIADFKNGKSRPLDKGNFPIYGGNGILGCSNQSNSKGEVVIIGRVGAYCGSVYFESRPIWISDNALFALPKYNYNSKFIYYLLKQLNLNQFAEGSSHPLLTQTLLNSIEIRTTVDPNEQSSIASILSGLDEKINLLQRQNKTLETFGEILFRQWYVEEAKESWKIYKFIDLVKHVKPGTNFQPKRIERGIPFLNVRNLNDGSLNYSDINYISEEEYKRVHKNWIPEENDILISRIGTLGVVAVISNEDLPVAVHYNMINLKAKSTSYQFLYFLVKSDLFQEKYHSIIRQSVQEYVAIEDVESIEIGLPIQSEVFKNQEEIFIKLFAKIRSNKNQIRTLKALRDALLPKLMKGELRVTV